MILNIQIKLKIVFEFLETIIYKIRIFLHNRHNINEIEHDMVHDSSDIYQYYIKYSIPERELLALCLEIRTNSSLKIQKIAEKIIFLQGRVRKRNLQTLK